jgi:hypothetical protein
MNSQIPTSANSTRNPVKRTFLNFAQSCFGGSPGPMGLEGICSYGLGEDDTPFTGISIFDCQLLHSMHEWVIILGIILEEKDGWLWFIVSHILKSRATLDY